MIYMPWDPGNTPKHIPRHLGTLTSILKKSNFDIPKSIFRGGLTLILHFSMGMSPRGHYRGTKCVSDD